MGEQKVTNSNPDAEEDSAGAGTKEAPGDVALCFSGGGIRSATFNLGVLQELARNGWLKKVDVLSTVSGGGYIGAWFAAQIARARQEVHETDDPQEKSARAQAAVIDSLARADERGEQQDAPAEPYGVDTRSAIARLRAYSNYLSPTWGLSKDALTLVAIYLRNLAIHWMILLPVVFATLLVPRVVHLIVLWPGNYLEWLIGLIAVATVAMGAFSTNGPPAPGERRSGRINVFWHSVCFALPLLVIPISFTALASAAGSDQAGAPALGAALQSMLESIGLAGFYSSLSGWAGSSPSSAVPFALAGGLLYGAGSLLVFLLRATMLAVPDVTAANGHTWVGRLNRWLRVDPGVSASGNFRSWSRRFFLRFVLSLFTGVLVGALCGLAWHAAVASVAQSKHQLELHTALLPVLFVLSIWMASVLRVAFATRLSSEPAREWWARATGASLLGIVVWVGAALLVLWLPLVIFEASMLRTGWAAGTAGLGGMLLAAATAAAGFWSKHGADISKEVVRWYDRLGRGAIDIAAALTLVGAALLMNLVVAFALQPLAAGLGDSPVQRSVPVCASSTRGDVKGAEVSAMRSVSCETGGLIFEAMPAHGFSSKEIEAARNRLVACCAMDRNPESLTTAPDLCPSSPKASDNLPAYDGTNQPVVDMLCPLAAEPKSKQQNAGAAGREGNGSEPSNASAGTPAHATKPSIWLAAGLPWPLQMALEYREGLKHTDIRLLLAAMLGLVLVSLLMSGLAGADTYSLQAMYANRLTRAYLGASNHDGSKADAFTHFNAGDDMALHEIRGVRPELVINAALNLTKVEEQTLAWQQRKACAFTMTALRCGRRKIGEANTADYRVDADPITLGQAISISGAAVSPNMGYHSSPAVAAVLTLFNLRLGRWLPNPGRPVILRGLDSLRALTAVLSELASKVGSGGDFVYVSDGGHFENMGVYAMLERGCRLIVAVDAGGDPKFAFEDVENLIRKARVDLGAELRIHDVHRCTDLIRNGQLRYLHGKVEYANGSVGTLVILKPVLCGDEPYDVTRYAETVRKAGSVFPQQTTADQFFDEAQFESYRMLGRHTIRQVFGAGGEPPALPQISERAPMPAAPVQYANTPSAQAGGGASLGNVIGGAAEAIKSIGSVGQAALLASAITLTGVVTLKDKTVSLDEASLDAIRNVSIPAKVDVNADGFKTALEKAFADFDWTQVSKSTSFGGFLQSLSTSLAEVDWKLSTVEVSNFTISSQPGEFPPDIPGSIDALKKVVEALSIQVSATQQNVKVFNGSLVELQAAVGVFQAVVEQGNPKLVVEAINALNTTLQDIQSDVQDISPRNTVRGGQ